MPPKTQKRPEYKPDDSGIPKNEVAFKFEFEIKHQAVQNFLILFEWFGPTSELTERVETALIETWIPKEDDPTCLRMEKNFDPIRIDDDFVKTLCKKKFYLYFYSIEDSKVYHNIELDFSSMISAKTSPFFQYSSDKIKIMEIEKFSLTIKGDKELLTELYKHYLNPFEIEIIGAKELPYSTENKFLPVYAKYQFFDGTQILSEKVPQGTVCKLNCKHTFLAGFMDQSKLKETLDSTCIKVEIHDRDTLVNETIKEETKVFDFQKQIDEEARKAREKEEELLAQQGKGPKGKQAVSKPQDKKEPPKDIKKKEVKKKDFKITDVIMDSEPQPKINDGSFGVSNFLLSEMLKPHIRTLKLRAPLVPNKKFEDHESNNLDLNNTARRDVKRTLLASSYMDNGSFCVISVSLAFPLGTFKKPAINVAEQLAPQEKGKKAASIDQQKNIVQLKEKNESEIQKANEIREIYERAIYIIPYKTTDLTIALEEIMNEVNLKNFNIKEGGLRALTTYSLSESEKKDENLDFVSGFEIIDSEFRMFFFEGLSDKAMKMFNIFKTKFRFFLSFEEKIPRTQANSDTFKIMKNSEIKFKERIYTDFNVSLKKIRLREKLTDILINPNIYLRTKVPENIMIVLNQLINIRKQWKIKSVLEYNLFPSAENLISVERKYSDSLSEEDRLGYEPLTEKKKKEKEKNKDIQKLKVDERIETSTITAESKLPDVSPLQTKEKEMSSPKIRKKNSIINKYQMKQSKSQINPEEEIYIYSSQPKNYYALQMDKLREKIRKDPDNFYTFSKEYLSLSIDPYTEEEKKQEEKQLSTSKIISTKMFHSLPKKNQEELVRHEKKPPLSTLDDLKENPWYLQKKEKFVALKVTRGDPIENDFKKYINKGKNKYFMDYESDKPVSKVEHDTINKNRIEKEKTEWKSKLLGSEYFYIHNKNNTQEANIDKFKGLLHDVPVKKGLVLKDSKIKESKIALPKVLNELPSSIYSMEKWEPPLQTRKLDLKKELHDDPNSLHIYQWDNKTKHDVLYSIPIEKITKKGCFD